MSYPTRSLSSHMRAPSAAGSSAQSPALLARIEEKKAELAHLKELQELSGAVATQMENLEQKLSTLSDGTEAIATVMGNWHNVLRAINMASSTKMPGQTGVPSDETTDDAAVALPQTLVRIPTEHAPVVQAQAEALEAEAAEGDSTVSR
ncbi:DASH complex subunit Dad2-domain-containing protein [Emericellopsis atlantica]|uniref:DASH complex subunit DAD2 n=1 Tax=Emericellopsis atlantica TaxID=2614577 RepID=A0A9P7ZR77_9HYPO|nr:DASH complex subunit Dad2-domain-containing protein [Emericellopsis atlantica]KAG9256322.1 DASH complex subunit Dad2-domain-containing protein [Emericellopsis atlantica]